MPNNTTQERPSLYRDSSFWAMSVTQFLGAFNDNLFKQLVLLLAVDKAGGGIDRQGEATMIFALPFFLLSGLAGFFSERISKTKIIVFSKAMEIVVMSLGLIAFLYYREWGLLGAMAVLGLMGLQSTFFGPPKYGILPEMLHKKDIPRANGFILMTTFVSIILGLAAAGFLKSRNVDQLWIASLVCIGIAIVGTITSLGVRYIPPANINLKFTASTLTIPKDMRKLIRGDKSMIGILIAVSAFWFLGGIVLQGVNSLGINQLQEDKLITSLLQICLAFGIGAGSVLGGKLCHGKANFKLVTTGAFGMLICFFLIGLPSISGIGDVEHNHLLGLYGSCVILVPLGMFAGVFVIPLQVVLQTRPSEGEKGQMIATMNVCTWFAILLSGATYMGLAALIAKYHWPESISFLVGAAVVLPIALFYRPKNK